MSRRRLWRLVLRVLVGGSILGCADDTQGETEQPPNDTLVDSVGPDDAVAAGADLGAADAMLDAASPTDVSAGSDGEVSTCPPARGRIPDYDVGPPMAIAPQGAAEVAADEVEVPGGTALLGCWERGERYCNFDHPKERRVSVERFFIDRHETSRRQYFACVDAGKCTYNQEIADMLAGEEHLDLPMTYLTWSEARQYCGQQGKRLCTEDEWEVAARGTCEANGCPGAEPECCRASTPDFTWGNSPFTCALAAARAIEPAEVLSCINTGCFCAAGMWLVDVGLHPTGASIYGVEDLVGNAHEFVLNEAPLDGATVAPLGPDWDTRPRLVKGVRGNQNIRDTYTFARRLIFPRTPDFYTGFRCCRTPGE